MGGNWGGEWGGVGHTISIESGPSLSPAANQGLHSFGVRSLTLACAPHFTWGALSLRPSPSRLPAWFQRRGDDSLGRSQRGAEAGAEGGQ